MPVSTYAYDHLRSNRIVLDGVQYHSDTSAYRANDSVCSYRPPPGCRYPDLLAHDYTNCHSDLGTHDYTNCHSDLGTHDYTNCHPDLGTHDYTNCQTYISSGSRKGESEIN